VEMKIRSVEGPPANIWLVDDEIRQINFCPSQTVYEVKDGPFGKQAYIIATCNDEHANLIKKHL
jgi:hypothetical protein